jgi:hypothetical protein
MHSCARSCITLLSLAWSTLAIPAQPPFTGKWEIELRTQSQRKQNVECGNASFALVQVGDQITGSHSMATAGCARINEGGDGTVKGVVVGTTAVLVVTSGRNGAIVMGTATLRAGSLHWRTVDEIRAGEPQGDSPLILGQGVLRLTTK